MSAKWFRDEYKGREGELETRADFEARTSVSEESLSSYFTRYFDQVPGVVKEFGKTKYFVADELDEFIRWISENSGKRSKVGVKEAEIARLQSSLEKALARAEVHRKNLEKVEQEIALRRRQLKRGLDDLSFLKQAEQ